jgi:hypothetical protein
MSDEHRSEGAQLQKAITQFEDQFKNAVESVWSETNDVLGSSQIQDSDSNGVPPLPQQVKPSKPEFRDRLWSVRFL